MFRWTPLESVRLVLGLKAIDITHSSECQSMLVSDGATLELAIKWWRGVGGWVGGGYNWQLAGGAILILQPRSVSLSSFLLLIIVLVIFAFLTIMMTRVE